MAASQPTATPSAPPRPGPMPSFLHLVVPSSLAPFNVSAREYLASHGDASWDGVAVGALVFSGERVLLVQRAKTDSLPDKWEVPSGVVSNDAGKDKTVAQAVARELWEEAGMSAQALRRLVTVPEGRETGDEDESDDGVQGEGYVFSNSTKTKVFCRFVFEVDVEEQVGGTEVTLNPWEHQDYVWATEEEVRELRVGEGQRAIELTSNHLRKLILNGFRLRKEEE